MYFMLTNKKINTIFIILILISIIAVALKYLYLKDFQIFI